MNSGQDYGEQKSNNNSCPPGYTKNNYKTVYCRFFLQYGHCSFGERCTYAHGEEDLQPQYIPIQNQDDVNMHNNNDGQYGQPTGNEEAEGRYGLDSNMYMGQQNQEKSSEVKMQLLDESSESKRDLMDIISCLQAQNYEEAKKIVENLYGKYSCLHRTSEILT